MAAGGTVSTTRDGAVATVTIPTVALTRATKDGLRAAIEAVAADDGIRCVVLTGTGRVFSAGQDLGEHAAALAADAAHSFDTLVEHFGPIVSALVEMPKPVVAAVNGTCAGAGIGLALACDVRIAVAGARFVTAFTGIGLTPDSALSLTLGRAVGAARASELVFRNTPFTADEALAWGLVGTVAEPAAFDGVVHATATALAAGPTLAYAAAKRAMLQAWPMPLAEILAVEHREQAALGVTADHADAVRAFLAKEQPTFTGRG